MHILITGGCGFIGSHLAKHHLDKGDQVFVVDDLTTGSLHNIASFQTHPHFQFEQATVETWQGLAKAIEWADLIYHMAAVVGIFRVLETPTRLLSTNIVATYQLLNTIATLKLTPRVILASSSSVYGHSNRNVLSETNDLLLKSLNNPLRNYALSKITTEALGIAYYQHAGIPITPIRIFNTIGPGQTGSYGMVVPRFIEQACTNQPLTIFGNGEQSRSFCDVRDLVTAIQLLVDCKEAYGEIINVGNDNEITMNQLAERIRHLAKSKSTLTYINYQDAYGIAFTDVNQRRPDLAKLYQLTHFQHQWTLEKTLIDLINLAYAGIHAQKASTV